MSPEVKTMWLLGKEVSPKLEKSELNNNVIVEDDIPFMSESDQSPLGRLRPDCEPKSRQVKDNTKHARHEGPSNSHCLDATATPILDPTGICKRLHGVGESGLLPSTERARLDPTCEEALRASPTEVIQLAMNKENSKVVEKETVSCQGSSSSAASDDDLPHKSSDLTKQESSSQSGSSGPETDATSKKKVRIVNDLCSPSDRLGAKSACPGNKFTELDAGSSWTGFKRRKGNVNQTRWLLMTPLSPYRFQKHDGKKFIYTHPYPYSWALDPLTLRWTKVDMRVIDNNNLPPAGASLRSGSTGQEEMEVSPKYRSCSSGASGKQMNVFASGSCGLVTAWRERDHRIIVGNPMVGEWYLTIVGNQCPLPRNINTSPFAVELVLDEKSKQPIKLLQFASSSTDLYAFSYCFRQTVWKLEAEIAFSVIDPAKHHARGLPFTCTHHGVVFLLIATTSRPARYLVVAYSVALGELAVTLPWAKPVGFHAPWENCLLMMQNSKESEEAPSGLYNTNPLRPQWLSMADKLQLVLGRSRGRQGPEIQVLRYSPSMNNWVLKDQGCVKRQERRDQLVGCATDDVPSNMASSTKRGSIKFVMADAGGGQVYVAAFKRYCTQVGLYDLGSGEYRDTPTPKLPVGMHDGEEEASYWRSFSMHSFSPTFVRGLGSILMLGQTCLAMQAR